MKTPSAPPVAVIGVACSLGGPGPGPELGPARIREAGLIERLRAAGLRVHDLGDVPIPPTQSSVRRGIGALAERVRQAVAAALDEGMLPLVLGGDHSPAVGSVTASVQHWQDLGLVWIDAHPDFNTPETSPSGNPHGMVLAALAGLVPTDFVTHSTSGAETGRNQPVVSPERIVVVGIRSVDEGEQQLLRRSRLKVYPWESIQRRGVADTLADALAYLRRRGVTRVHMSVDLDVLDPGGWPGVSTPAPGGPDLKALTDIVRGVAEGTQVIAMDIVELNPERDQSGRTAEAAIQIAEAALLKRP